MFSGRDRTHGDEASVYPYQSNQVFPASYPGQGSFGASHRTNLNSSSSSSHMFSPGQSISKFDESSGDPSGWCLFILPFFLFCKQNN